jgi:pilus assembly protein TadC
MESGIMIILRFKNKIIKNYIKPLLTLTLITFLTIVFGIVNHYYGDILINFINKTLIGQCVILWLTLITLLGVFFPVSLRREYGKKEITNISSEEIKKDKKKDIDDKYFENRSTIG